MNEEPPTPFDTVGDEPVEARIVAWVLGESSAFEAAELERLCEERPELLVFHRRMRTLHGLLTEAEAAEPDHSWKLPTEKRKVLDGIIGEEKIILPDPQKEHFIRRAGLRAFFAIAACLVMAVVVLQLIHPIWITQGPLRSVERKVDFMPPSGRGGQDLARGLIPPPNAAEADSQNFRQAIRDQEDKVEERRKVLATNVRSKGIIYQGQDSLFGQSTMDEDQAPRSKKRASLSGEPAAPASVPAGPTGGYKVILPTVSSKRELGLQQTARQLQLAKQPAKSQSGALSSDLAAVFSMLDNPEPSMPVEALPSIAVSGLSGGGAGGRGFEMKLKIPPSSPEALPAEMESVAKDFSEMATASRSEMLLSDSFFAGGPTATANELSLGLRSGDQAINRNNIDAILNNPNWQAMDGAVKAEKLKDESDVGAAETAPALVDLMEESPASENPYSTFSLNISDASFQLAKAALAKGERPDPDSIKPEQFYNAVDYGDPAPSSNEPVAATIEQSAHPIIPGRNLVRVALRAGSAGRSAAQPLRLTLLVDQSGSMVREDRRAAMEHALAQLGGLLTKADLVTVIGFSRIPHLLAEARPGDEAGKLDELVNQTASEGGTNLEEAMKLGAEKALSHQLAGAQNRIVLFTDGAANLGNAKPERLAELVKSFRQKGIAFDIAGIGAAGLNDRLLSELARNGNGRYYVVGNEKNDSFARQLAGAFRPAAENVKVQVNFNPQRVGKYKLIGFEKDRLETEDFRNDAVDAAELAAEEAGVALYQVEPLADGSGELGEVSVRFRDAASQEMVERTWTIPYASQATAFDRATPSMQLAGLSLLAAEKLKGGPLADAIDFKQLTGPDAFVKQFYGSSPRVSEMLQVIEKLR